MSCHKFKTVTSLPNCSKIKTCGLLKIRLVSVSVKWVVSVNCHCINLLKGGGGGAGHNGGGGGGGHIGGNGGHAGPGNGNGGGGKHGGHGGHGGISGGIGGRPDLPK